MTDPDYDFSDDEKHDPPRCREHGLDLVDEEWSETQGKWVCPRCGRSTLRYEGVMRVLSWDSDEGDAWKKWAEGIRKQAAIGMDKPKVDMEKVRKFLADSAPKCVDDVISCYIPSSRYKPSAGYPLHWEKGLALDLFSAHYKGYEGDWMLQKRYY